MAPGRGAGSAATSRERVAIFESCGHTASNKVPIRAEESAHATFPSAAFGLIVKPSGKVINEVRSSEEAGVSPLWDCGTLIVRSSPEAVSERSVVGLASML